MNDDELIAEHLGLAHSLALQVWRTAPHALEYDELRSIANLGLVRAARRWVPFCEENGHSADALQFFRPFVVRRVYGELIDAIRKADWAKRPLRNRAKALRAAGQDEGASHEELAQRTGMSLAKIRGTIRDMAQRPVSLEGEELEPRSRQDVESSVFAQAVLDRVVAVVRRLPSDQQAIIALRYHHGLQLQAVAHIMGIAESRASQLHAEAVLAIHQEMLDVAQEQA